MLPLEVRPPFVAKTGTKRGSNQIKYGRWGLYRWPLTHSKVCPSTDRRRFDLLLFLLCLNDWTHTLAGGGGGRSLTFIRSQHWSQKKVQFVERYPDDVEPITSNHNLEADRHPPAGDCDGSQQQR